MNKLFPVLAVAVSILMSVFGQEPQSKPAPLPQPTPSPVTAPTPTEEDDAVVRITTKLVQVDATVTDRGGNEVII